MSETPTLAKGARYETTQHLQTAVGTFFNETGRSFTSGRKGGSKQKYYVCSGKGGGCPVEVKAYKGKGGWNITGLVDVHTNCSGGMAKGKSTALQGMAADAMRDNPQLTGVALKRKLERTGLKVTDRTATRLKNNAKKAHHAAVAGSYQQLPSLCAELEKNSPGTVAEVEVSRSI
ncbi:unnamed protein product [Pylaiella littoralis]